MLSEPDKRKCGLKRVNNGVVISFWTRVQLPPSPPFKSKGNIMKNLIKTAFYWVKSRVTKPKWKVLNASDKKKKR